MPKTYELSDFSCMIITAFDICARMFECLILMRVIWFLWRKIRQKYEAGIASLYIYNRYIYVVTALFSSNYLTFLNCSVQTFLFRPGEILIWKARMQSDNQSSQLYIMWLEISLFSLYYVAGNLLYIRLKKQTVFSIFSSLKLRKKPCSMYLNLLAGQEISLIVFTPGLSFFGFLRVLLPLKIRRKKSVW